MQGQPPFQIGDRVIRTGESMPEDNMFQDQRYTVSALEYCCTGRGWTLNVEECTPNGPGWTCLHCMGERGLDWKASLFRKVDDSQHTVESLLEELSKVKEPVLV